MRHKGSWERRLEGWLEPFEQALGDQRRRGWAPLYVQGLLLPGERKSMLAISQRVAPEEKEQLHHFIGGSGWETGPLEDVLCEKVDALLGGPEAHLIVDDTSLPKNSNQQPHQDLAGAPEHRRNQVLDHWPPHLRQRGTMHRLATPLIYFRSSSGSAKMQMRSSSSRHDDAVPSRSDLRNGPALTLPSSVDEPTHRPNAP